VQLTSTDNLTLESIHVNFVQYFFGGTLLAMTVGAVGFIMSLLLLTLLRRKP
jgi:hypothetical protein